ncbi:MAG: hypothetical protein Q4P72_01355 [Eubacteriales bacterium]|nr:hypothetical protein [Eubacteriales bacterium]
MQLKVGRKIYDTEKAEYIGDQTVGYFGAEYGFCETLYRKGKDDFFIVGLGGSASPYPEETLAVLDMEATEEWLRRVLGDERAEEVLERNRSQAAAAAEKKPVVKKAATKKPAVKKTAEKKPVAKKTAEKSAAKAETKSSSAKSATKKSTKKSK